MRLAPTTKSRPGIGCRGFSLAEMMVSVAIGTLVFAAVMALSVYSSRSFAAMGNYMDLDKVSRNALDNLSRDIRQTTALQTYATNKLVFTDYDTNALTFEWKPNTGQLTRTKSGVTTVLLSECDFLNFHISQRNPSNNVWGFYPATNNPAIAKLIDVSWRCSRKMFGNKVNTESVQTAKIVIRN